MSDKLNIKQEKFIQGIIRGLSQRQAYKEAYEVNYDDNAIDIKASQLFNKDKVQIRYKELIKELEGGNYKKSQNSLYDIVKEPENKDKKADIVVTREVEKTTNNDNPGVIVIKRKPKKKCC